MAARVVSVAASAGPEPITANNRWLFLRRVVEVGLLAETHAYRLYAQVLGLPFENPDVLDLDVDPHLLGGRRLGLRLRGGLGRWRPSASPQHACQRADSAP